LIRAFCLFASRSRAKIREWNKRLDSSFSVIQHRDGCGAGLDSRAVLADGRVQAIDDVG